MVDKNHDATLYEQQESDLKGRGKLDPEYSIREKMLDAMPSYADILASIQDIVNKNNERVAQAIIHSARDFESYSTILPTDAQNIPKMIPVPFDVRHVLVRNYTSVPVIISNSPPTSNAGTIAGFLGNNNVFVEPGAVVSMPIHLGSVIWAVYGGTIANFGADFAALYFYSQPQDTYFGNIITSPVVFKTFNAGAAATDVTIWTPATGKRARALGMHMGAGGGVTHTILNGSGGTELWRTFRTSFGNTWDFGARGIIGSRDTALVLTRDAVVGVGGVIFGVEE